MLFTKDIDPMQFSLCLAEIHLLIELSFLNKSIL